MSNRLRQSFVVLSCLAVLVWGTSCGNGGPLGGLVGNNFVSMNIGIGGGTLITPDGNFKMIIPPGALPDSENISISNVASSDLSPATTALNPTKGFVIAPANLVFAAPVKVQFNTSVPAFADGVGADGNPEGVVSGSGFPTLEIVIANDQILPNQILSFVEGNPAGILEAEILGGGVVVTANIAGPGGFQFDGFSPDSLAQGLTDQVDVFLDVPGAAIPSSPLPAVFWGIDVLTPGSLSFGIPGGASTPFGTGSTSSALIPGMNSTLFDSTSINCLMTGTFQFQVNVVLQGFDIQNLLFQQTGAALMGNANNIAILVTPSVDCLPSQGPAVQVFPLALNGMDGTRLVSPNFILPPGSPMGHYVTIANEDGVAVVNANTGTIVYNATMMLQGNYFEGAAFPAPMGFGGFPAIIGSGFSGFGVVNIDPVTGLPSGSPVLDPAMRITSDLVVRGNQPELGGFVIDTSNPEILPIDFLSTNWSVATQGSFVFEFMRSGVASATSPNQLFISFGVGSGQDGPLSPTFYQIDNTMSQTSGPVLNFVASLGSDPGQIRWDPASGIGGITDFTDSTVTIFTWDGAGLPVVTATAMNVAQGPFTLDVNGTHIVAAAPVGNAVTIINVDPSGLILSQNDIPMPAGTFVPTGVTFLRDLLNSVFVVCDGTSEGVLIPNAY